MKKLAIDWMQLEMAFDDSSYESSYYLDTETGQVLMVTEETRWKLESIYEEYAGLDDSADFDLPAILPQMELPDWQQEEVLIANEIGDGFNPRYLAIPERQTGEAYQIMRDFIVTVEDERLEDRLWNAISGRGAFRYFKDVLAQYPQEQKRWHAYQEARFMQQIHEWLEMEGIEPTNQPRQAASPEKESDSIRQQMLEEVVWFTQAASRLDGVTRIALIGSLATDKAHPKDVDMLVTITPEVDLAKLATLGRKLQGHMQNIAHGGELFLADPQHRYLGRTCPWKQCGPGIRASCDALHCGRWQYLHDDFETIKLPAELITTPPIELWPQVMTRVALPHDVTMMLQKIEEL